MNILFKYLSPSVWGPWPGEKVKTLAHNYLLKSEEYFVYSAANML